MWVLGDDKFNEPIVMYTGTGTGTSSKSYYHTDAQGSVIALTNSSGTVTDKYVYTPFGDSSDITTGNPIRYTGRRFDAETGLYYYRARYYSPTLGRFLQADPIGYGDNMNMYAYTDNDPLDFRDPSGMAACVGVDGSFDCYGPTPSPFASQAIDSLFSRIAWFNGVSALSGGIVAGFTVALYPTTLGDGTVLNSDKNNDKSYAGKTPADKPQDYKDLGPRKGRKSKPVKNKDDGSVWEADRDGHEGSEWKRWPSERAWRSGKGRESVRPDGATVKGPGDGK